MENLVQKVKSQFMDRFNEEPLLITSPGRINLIGEHTDYNNGFVLPAAIDRYVVGGFSVSRDDSCLIYSIDFDEEVHLSLEDIKPKPKGSWENYILGVIKEMQSKDLPIGGFNLAFGGNIPKGAGLSSSAALENCIAFGLNELFQMDVTKDELIAISQKVEHNYVGVECGIMDQYTSMLGQKDQAILLDCENLESQYIPALSDTYQWILLDTRVKHSLVESAYNQRRQECEYGVKALQKIFNPITSLCQAEINQLEVAKSQLSTIVYNRCLYVIEENKRVLQAAGALRNQNWKELGGLMYESHEGLQHKYEVSCAELDFLVDQTKPREEVLGSRMMGGGFGGCTLNLVEKSHAQDFINEMKVIYQDQFNIKLSAYEVSITDGSHVL